jgi:class 3 adenylate cyclase/tetratricopeptide (TPR) repeat protein
MTVMFCDLVDSTPLAQTLDPEDFRELLTDYRQSCLQAVERFGGYTAVYAGDGMTVYFGYPRAHEDDAQRAVFTGLQILDGIADLNARLRDLYSISVQVRIGVHSGVVIAEELGGGDAETRSQLDVSGEMPHIASRIESAAPPDSVVVSDDTLALVEGYFDAEALGQKELKGVSRPVGLHRILAPTGAVGRLQVTTATQLTPVVGRRAELAQLSDAWERVRKGEGTVAHITGEAGIGKSRLVHELVRALGAELSAVVTWQCSAHHQSTALYPVVTYLERLRNQATPEVDEAKLEEALSAAHLEPDASHTLTPRDARTASLHVLESFLTDQRDRLPLLLVVEDLHWADPTTIELLGRIIRSLADKQVLCLLTFRRDREPPWSSEEPVVEIELGPLLPSEVRAMASAASEGALDGRVLEWVESTADGVPLFVEEMLKAGPAPADTGVPPTLEGLLTERLDRLPEFSDVIDTAAILGREFEKQHLAALEPLGGDAVEPAVTQLVAQDVLRPVIGAPSRCEFSHGLLHEAAYARILRRRRRVLHARVAETIVAGFPEAVEREPELVARHWSAAARAAEAVPYWHAAGTRALERAAYLEAAEHFRHGVEALDAAATSPDDLQHVDFLTHIGASLQAGRGYAAAGVDDAYARARSACERVCNDDRLAPIIHGQWMFHLLRGEYGEALARADELLALAQRTGGRLPAAEAHLDHGLVHMYLGEFDLAREHLEEAFAQYQPRESADHVYEAQGDTGVGALAYLALVLWNLGHADESLERSDASLARAETVGGPVTRAQAWGVRSILHLSRAEPVELGQWIRRTHAHSIDHDLGYWRAASALIGAWLQGRAGALNEGMQRLEGGLGAYATSGSKLGLPHFHILYADLKRVAGDKQGALEQLRAAERHIEETGERLSESELFRFKGRLLMSGDDADPDAALAAFDRAVLTAREQNAKLLELQAATRLAEHQLKLGAPCTALERVGELSDWFGPGSDLMDVIRARALVASETMAR